MARIRLPPRPLQLQVLPVVMEDIENKCGDLVREAFLAVVEQLRSDEELLKLLLRDWFGERPDDRWIEKFGVRQIVEVGRDEGRSLWRFKIWKLENGGLQFRFFYGYFEPAKLIVILGIDERHDDTYDPGSELVRRVCADFDRLFAKYG